MSTLVKDVAEVVSAKPPTNGQKPAYLVCWLFIAKKVSGDKFTGKIRSMKFTGNNLHICLEPMKRVEENDKADNSGSHKHWRSIPQSPIKSVGFEFEGCVKIDKLSDTEKVVFVSSTKEAIILSNKAADITATEDILAQP